MTVRFVPKQHTEPKWRLVQLNATDAIEIAIARPTLEEQLRSLSESKGVSYQAYALAAGIKDWRGVIDEHNQPVTYSWSALSELCTAYPDAAFELLAVHRTATQGLTETERKNSSSPPVSGGEILESETTVTTEFSNSGATSSG
jgi:hypothetical protein